MPGVRSHDANKPHGRGFAAAAEIVAIPPIRGAECHDLFTAAGTLESLDAGVTGVIDAHAEVSLGLRQDGAEPVAGIPSIKHQ